MRRIDFSIPSSVFNAIEAYELFVFWAEGSIPLSESIKNRTGEFNKTEFVI